MLDLVTLKILDYSVSLLNGIGDGTFGSRKDYLALGSSLGDRLELFDLAGRRVRDRSFEPSPVVDQSWTIDRLDRFAPGLYALRLTQAGAVETAKLLIMR